MAGIVRQPRAWVNGVNVIECTVNLVRGEQASTFDAVMALDDPSNPGAAYWGGTAPIPATVTGTDGSNSATLFEGWIVKVECDFTERVVRVHGMDDVLDFASQRNDQKYPNMTTSQVVQQIAGNHGYSVQSDGGSDQAGTTFNNQEYAYNTDVENDWDAIAACAEQDGKVCYLDGINKILHYVNPGDMPNDGNYSVEYTPPTAEMYETGNVIHLQCTRDIQIAEGVQGQAASWNTRDKQAYSSSTGQE